MSKYKSKRCEFKGIKFDSRKEGLHYLLLEADERDGKIFNLELQPKFKFELNGVNLGFYKADFQYNEGSPNGPKKVVDVKSVATQKLPVYRLKKKMMKAFYGIEIVEVM